MTFPTTRVRTSPTSMTIGRRDGFFRFLDLPAELRNRIYKFAATTQVHERHCFLPCLSLTHVCRQIDSEYRPICMKVAVTIEWKDIPGYLNTFYPTVNSKVENLELAPTKITVVSGQQKNYEFPTVEIDLLPIVKIGLHDSSFSCQFTFDKQILPFLSSGFNRERKDHARILNGLSKNRHANWISDIKTGKLVKILVTNSGIGWTPWIHFYLSQDTVLSGNANLFVPGNEDTIGWNDDEDAYFTSRGVFDCSPNLPNYDYNLHVRRMM